MKDFIIKLHKRLSEPLPGLNAQLKLAPKGRILFKEQENKINAGVILLIFPDEKGILKIVFIKRPSYNGHHSGQISFPGGKEESGDKSLEQTAIRETHEELGIPELSINIIGKLTELYIPVSNFLVHPYVAYYEKTPRFKIEKSEVDYLIFSSLQQLKEINISFISREYEGKQYDIPYYNIENEMIWGATSMILSEFIEIIKETEILS